MSKKHLWFIFEFFKNKQSDY